VQGYTTADEYDLEGLRAALEKQDLYVINTLTTTVTGDDNNDEPMKTSKFLAFGLVLLKA